MIAADSLLEACESHLFAERAEAASAKLAELGDVDALAPPHRDRARWLELRTKQLLNAPIDRLALQAMRYRDLAADPYVRAQLCRELSRYYAYKRCDQLATEAAQAATLALPTSTVGADAMAHAHVLFDRRHEALRVYEGARHLDEGWRAELGIAWVAYVLADFARVLDTVAAIASSPATRVPILRWRAAVHQVRAEWEQHLCTLDLVLEATRDGYRYRSDRLQRASTLFKLGRRDDALEAYRSVWRDNETDGCGRFAREVLNHVERGAGKGRVFLPAFPTTTQKRNYCGPAVLELVLRHLGADADQDRIAKTVKHPDGGSPMVRMAKYLEAQGLATRRFEGTAPRLRACLALGLPVIVQEEYSTTMHVAVVVGIDEEVGLLFVQDPMTHATSERLVQSQERLGALFRQGALVAHRADAELAGKLDLADVKDQEHIRLVDSCDEDDVVDKPNEVLKRCAKAIALCPDYPMAWNRRAYELLWLAQRSGSREQLAVFLSILREVRVRYGAIEWPHQVHARYLMWQQRNEEALIELEDALRLDPGDANNAQYIAELHAEQKRAKEATAGYWRALTLDVAHVRATENFAAHALAEGELALASHLSACAREMNPNNGFNHYTASRIADKLELTDDAIRHARKAVAIDAKGAWPRRQLAMLLKRKQETTDEALELFRALSKESPGWFEPRLEAASILWQRERTEEAIALVEEGIACAKDEPKPLVERVVEWMGELGRVNDALALVRKVAETRKTLDARLAWLKLLQQEERQLDAMKLARELLTERENEALVCGEVASCLPPDEAQKALHKAVALAPDWTTPRGRLVEALKLRDPAEAVKVSLAAPTETGWLLGIRAGALNEAGRYEEATRASVEAWNRYTTKGLKASPQWIVVEYVRSIVRDGEPAAALEKLALPPEAGGLERLAQLALYAAAGDHERLRAAAKAMPLDDVSTARLFVHATLEDEAMRPALEERLRAVVAAGTSEQREFEAMLAGSRAVAGDDESLARLLAQAKRASRILWARASLGVEPHAGLRQRIFAAARAHEPESRIVLEAEATEAARRGDVDQACKLRRQMTERFPLEHAGFEHLGRQLLLRGDSDEAHALIDRALSLTVGCYDALALAAVSLLLRGRRDEAARRAAAARSLYCGWGVQLRRQAMLTASLAVLSGDRAGIDHAATLTTPVCTDSPLWTALRALG